jgi:DNA-binding MarR family transcriptional regulator
MPDAPDLPADEVMQTCAANHTRMAARTITRAYDQALQPCGLRVTQFTILVALTKTAFDSITQMADQLALERSSLSRNLDRLEERGLLRMRKDGRSHTIELTDDGAAKVEEAYPHWRAAQDAIEDAIGIDAWTDARALLRSLAKTGAALE